MSSPFRQFSVFLLALLGLAACQTPMLGPATNAAAGGPPNAEDMASRLAELYRELGVTPDPATWLEGQAALPPVDCPFAGEWRKVDDRQARLRIAQDGAYLTVLDGDESATRFRYAFDGKCGRHAFHRLEQGGRAWVLRAFVAELAPKESRLVWTFHARACMWADGKVATTSHEPIVKDFQREEGVGS